MLSAIPIMVNGLWIGFAVYAVCVLNDRGRDGGLFVVSGKKSAHFPTATTHPLFAYQV